jgi:gluconate transporter
MIDPVLLFAVLAGIVLLLVMILYFKVQAFLALLISSIAVGLIAGMPAEAILKNIQLGMGNTLGFIAIVVGLGAMFGAILQNSGGIQSLASAILNRTGEKRASWALMVTGFLVAIPVFFDVAFVILVPVVYALQKKTGKSLLFYGIPLVAGLAITHAFIPPTPGPVAVADILGADLGWVIFAGFVAGIPSAIISGPIFATFISKKIKLTTPELGDIGEGDIKNLPSAGMVGTLVGIPLFLILINTIVNSPATNELQISPDIKNTLRLIGHPFIALIIANLLAWYLLGVKRGYTKGELLKISSESLAPAGLIILITGAGGVFKEILTATGAGKMIAESMTAYGFSVIVFAFLTAAVVRILQGSSTVAMITSAGMTAAFIEGMSIGAIDKAFIVVAIASGATIFSHVNDSGFWLVSKYFGMTEQQTLKSWTIMTTIIAFTGFLMSLLLSMIF